MPLECRIVVIFWGRWRLVGGDLPGAEDVYLLIYYTDEVILGKSAQFYIYDLCFPT